MDEEQGLASPIAGGIRAVRNTVSSSIFSGRAVPPPVQADPQTTSLLTQNSLTLTTVSRQLENISVTLSTLNFSLSNIKDNLALSDRLERQRESAKRNRERILAEQGLREGKESDIEKRIQFALLTPVRRIAAKTQGILGRLVNFFLVLAGGWLTNTLVEMIQANAEGNVDLLKNLQRKLGTGLLVIGATLTAATIGLSKLLSLTALLASRAFRFGFNNILRRPFQAVIQLLRTRLGRALGIGVGGGGGIGGAILSIPLLGGFLNFVKKQFDKLGSFFGKKPFGVEGGQIGPTPPPAMARTGGILGPFRKIFGGVRGTFAFSTLFDIFINGENPIEAIKNNLGGIIVAAIAAPLVIAATAAIVKFLGLPILAGTILKFIFGSVFFGLGKNLFSKFKLLGGNQTQTTDNNEDDFIATETQDISFGGGSFDNQSENSTSDTLIAQTTNDADNIVPVNNKKEMNVADNISNLEEGSPTIITIPSQESEATQPTQIASTGQVDNAASDIPFIGFDNDNIHTTYAVTTFGAFA